MSKNLSIPIFAPLRQCRELDEKLEIGTAPLRALAYVREIQRNRADWTAHYRVGVFATLTNSYALVAVGASENFYRYDCASGGNTYAG
jgi:hypothetical protein